MYWMYRTSGHPMTASRNAMMMQEAETAMSEAATRNEIGFASRAIFMEDLRVDYVASAIRFERTPSRSVETGTTNCRRP
jgi:hypothetical protein